MDNISHINKWKPICASMQTTWILIYIMEGMWDKVEGFGMGRQIPSILIIYPVNQSKSISFLPIAEKLS